MDIENKVFKSKNNKKPMTFIQLCEFLYKAGYSEKEVSFWTMDRIAGTHCNCGNGKGEFVLSKIDCRANKESGKLYMKCRVCNNYSHL